MALDFFGNAMSQIAGAFNSGFNAITDRQRFEQMANQLGLSLSNEAARQFDLTYENQKRQIEQQYRVALMQARTAEEAQRATAEYQRAQVALAEQRLALDTELGRGRLDLDRELGQGRLGLDYLSTAANMRGPQDWAQYSDLMRGASQRQDVPVFVQALLNNSRMPAFQAAGGSPTPVSAEAMLAQVTGQGGGTGAGAGSTNSRTQDEMAFAAIADIGARGANQLGGGALEQLLPEERQMLASGLERAGYSMPAFLTQYARSRVNNRVQDAARA